MKENGVVRRMFAYAPGIVLSAFLMAPAAGIAAEGDPVDQQVPEEVVAPLAAPTPQAAIQWHEMETARRANRDRAAAMRQLLVESGEEPAESPAPPAE